MQTMRLVEGYNPPSRFRPGTLGLTLMTTGLFVSGLFFLNPKVIPSLPSALKTIRILPDPPPPPPQKQVEHKQVPQKVAPYVPPTHPEVIVPKAPDITFAKEPPLGPPLGEGTSTGTVIEPARHDPVLVGANIDPRYANNFQPTYPPDQIREGNAGRVMVRVLIGTDGRVKDIEKLSAPSDSFWEATRRQALSKWRFKPATRDGVPYEAWKTMNVSFVLNQEQ